MRHPFICASILAVLTHVSLAHAEPPCFDETSESGYFVDPFVLAELGSIDDVPVRLMAVECEGDPHYGFVDYELWISVGDESFYPKPDLSGSGPSIYSVSSVSTSGTLASFTLSEDHSPVLNYADYLGPKISFEQRWSFDFETRSWKRLSAYTKDPRQRVLSKLARRARSGEVEAVFDEVHSKTILYMWDLDPTRVMTYLLRGVDQAARRARINGDAKRAAAMVHVALSPMWKNGITIDGASFSYRGDDDEHPGTERPWSVVVSRETSPAWLYTNMGYYLTEGGEHALAIQLLDAVVVAFPEHTPAWLNLGDARAALGDEKGAREAYDTYARQRRASKRSVPSRIENILESPEGQSREK